MSNLKNFIFVLTVFYGLTTANATLKRRLTVIEKRVGVIETRLNTDKELANEMITLLQQNDEELNASIHHLEDQIPPRTENEGKETRHQTGNEMKNNVDIPKQSQILVSLGLEKEKQWARDQVGKLTDRFNEHTMQLDNQFSDLRNEIHLQNEQLIKNYSNFMTELLSENEHTKSDLKLIVSNIDIKFENSLRKINKAINHSNELLVAQKNLINQQQKEIEKIKKTQAYLLKVAKTCPSGWIRYSVCCYLYVKERKTFSESKAYCESLESTLTDFDNQAENLYIVDKFQINSLTWIGYTDEEDENTWVSLRTGRPAAFMNFRMGQPDGRISQNCAMIGDLKPWDYWNDNKCIFIYNFICKKNAFVMDTGVLR